MKRTRAWWTTLGSTGLAAVAAGAIAQQPAQPPAPPSTPQQQPKLASVTIINVANDVARNIGVDTSQIPLNVQVPMDVAAGVCGIGADVLAQQAAKGVAQCTAQNTTRALDDAVQRQVQGNAQK